MVKKTTRGNPNWLISKISENEDIISQKFIKLQIAHAMEFYIKIMPNGDIYTQNSDNEKNWIEKYPADWFNK